MEDDKYHGRRVLTSDSVLSEGTAASRESLGSISNTLLNMELELDQTLRDLDDTKNRSKSPSTNKRYPSSNNKSSHHHQSSNIRTRSGSIDPLASSRRSGSIDPGAHSEVLAARLQETTERMEALEKENHLLETKYDQQRKRLNLVSFDRMYYTYHIYFLFLSRCVCVFKFIYTLIPTNIILLYTVEKRK